MKLLRAAVLAAVFLIGLGLRGRAFGPGPGSDSPRPDPPVSVLLLLKADTFLCAPCLDRILAEMSGLSRKSGRAILWSVVLYPPPEAGAHEDENRSVVIRRAESVLRANGLEGPLVVDEAKAWQEACPEAAALLVLDGRSRSIHRFALPLPPEGVALLNGILNEGGDHDSNRDHS